MTKTGRARDTKGAGSSSREPAEGAYLFCVIDGESGKSLPKRMAGLPGSGPPRLLELGGRLKLVVADAPLARFDKLPLERGLRDLDWVSRCAIAHDKVVLACAALGTVMPMKLFTVFKSQERALEHVRRLRPKLERLAEKLADRSEWGVRIRLELGKARERALLRAAKSRPPTSGRGFLALKQEQRKATGTLTADARDSAEQIFGQLAASADAAEQRGVTREQAAQGLLLDAAFLVASEDANAFKRLVDREAGRYAKDGLAVTLTGPWPPYTFVSEVRRRGSK